MAKKNLRNLRDDLDTWWTIDETAEHFGITRASVLRWIRDEHLVLHGRDEELRLHREDVLEVRRRRSARQHATRFSAE